MHTISPSGWVTVFCGVALLGVVSCRAQTPGEGEVRNIGSRLELFVDEYMIESMNGVSRNLHSPQPREVVFKFDQPWEGVAGGVTVFEDDDIFRMYYVGIRVLTENPRTYGTRICGHAESTDGIHWTRPNVGLYEDEDTGTKNNNIVLWPTDRWRHATDNFAPFKDTNPNCPPEARYKGVGRTIRVGGELGAEESAEGFGEALAGNLAFQSPDGIHWSLTQREPIVVGDGFDALNMAFWDPVIGRYREYHREFRRGYRDMMTSTSEDFLHWTEPQWVEYGGAPAEHLYAPAVLPYFRAPHILVAFPFRLVGGRPVGENDPESEVTGGVFMSSRDGLNFDRSFMEGWIRPGLDPYCWRHGNTAPAWGLLQTGPEELSVYWIQHSHHPGMFPQLRRGTLRTDGFVSVHAKYAGGEFTTKPLNFAGRELVMNFSTSEAGSVRVEIQDQQGNSLPGFTLTDCPEIYGDGIEEVVKWKTGSDVSALAGQVVRLRFVLKDADLYSIRFRE